MKRNINNAKCIHVFKFIYFSLDVSQFLSTAWKCYWVREYGFDWDESKNRGNNALNVNIVELWFQVEFYHRCLKSVAPQHHFGQIILTLTVRYGGRVPFSENQRQSIFDNLIWNVGVCGSITSCSASVSSFSLILAASSFQMHDDVTDFFLC